VGFLEKSETDCRAVGVSVASAKGHGRLQAGSQKIGSLSPHLFACGERFFYRCGATRNSSSPSRFVTYISFFRPKSHVKPTIF
jgi:hypothetical protein